MRFSRRFFGPRGRLAGAVVAAIAAATIGWSTFSTSWFVADAGDFRAGLLRVEACGADGCRTAAVTRYDRSASLLTTGMLVTVVGVLAAAALLVAAAGPFIGGGWPWVRRLAAQLAIGALVAGLVFYYVAPWPEMMSSALASSAFFAGCAGGAASALVLLRVRRAG